jgi:hypothetical protein
MAGKVISAASTVSTAKIRSLLTAELEKNFMATLGQEPDIINIVMGLFQMESSLNNNKVGVLNSAVSGGGKNFLESSAVSAVMKTRDPEKTANIENCLRAIGIGQVVGWNFVRGGSSTGKCEIERVRPDLAAELLIEPGEDIFGVILGEANMPLAIRATLIMLEGKFRSVFFTGTAFQGRGDFMKRLFPSRVSAAVAGYLGYAQADKLKTTPEAYSASIVGGASYRIANGATSAVQTAVIASSSTSPSTNGSGQKPIGIPGCG